MTPGQLRGHRQAQSKIPSPQFGSLTFRCAVAQVFSRCWRLIVRKCHPHRHWNVNRKEYGRSLSWCLVTFVQCIFTSKSYKFALKFVRRSPSQNMAKFYACPVNDVKGVKFHLYFFCFFIMCFTVSIFRNSFLFSVFFFKYSKIDQMWFIFSCFPYILMKNVSFNNF